MLVDLTSGLVMVTASVRPLPLNPGGAEAFSLWCAVLEQLGKG